MRVTALVAFLAITAAAQDDPILQAMRDEVARSREIKLETLDTPYFIEAQVEDLETFSATASLGALIRSGKSRARLPRVQIRVGDPSFDNTNYFQFGGDSDRLPVENAYPVMRRYLWLALDQSYKSALAAIARKRAALKNVTSAEQLADFAKAEPLRLIEDLKPMAFAENAWVERAKAMSVVLAKYSELRMSAVEMEAIRNTHYLVNSEGTEIRIPENLLFLRARGFSQAPDGMILRDAVVFHAHDPKDLAAETEISRELARFGENLTALAKAPRGEAYTGPVMFEGNAAGQLFAQVLGKSFVLVRRPVMDPGRQTQFPTGELEGRVGSRILPEWMDVIDDPTQTEWRGRSLFGSYKVDSEGIRPLPLTLVEKGVLKGYLLTRQPQRGYSGSNGRARLPGAFGHDQASFGNLFIKARETSPDLKKKLVETIVARGKPYGLLIRKLDFPSSGSIEELRRTLSPGQSGRPMPLPILVYKVLPDGSEELVRGLRFRSLNARSLKDIMAASDETSVFEFLDSAAPLALMGSGGIIAEASVIAPSVLIDDLELDRIEQELPKLPVVPPPS